jgi:hypothetical protein
LEGWGVGDWVAVTGECDSDWSQKRAEFWGYNGIFGGKKKVMGVMCRQSQKTLHRRAGLAYDGQVLSRGIEFLPFVGIENLPPLSFVDRFLSV